MESPPTPPKKGFNNSLGIFLPKGTADDDTINSVEGSAENTRPLSLKNTDNKAIAAAVNHARANAITKWADPQQNDFICGRPGLNNIIDIDARARVSDSNATASHANLPCPQKKPQKPGTINKPAP